MAMRKPGTGGDVERHAPAEVGADEFADQIADGGADGDGRIEDGEDLVAVGFGVKV